MAEWSAQRSDRRPNSYPPFGQDAGAILLSDDSLTHYDPELKCHVYEHEYFSPLGDALVNLARLAGEKK